MFAGSFLGKYMEKNFSINNSKGSNNVALIIGRIIASINSSSKQSIQEIESVNFSNNYWFPKTRDLPNETILKKTWYSRFFFFKLLQHYHPVWKSFTDIFLLDVPENEPANTFYPFPRKCFPRSALVKLLKNI